MRIAGTHPTAIAKERIVGSSSAVLTHTETSVYYHYHVLLPFFLPALRGCRECVCVCMCYAAGIDLTEGRGCSSEKV